MDFGQLLLDAFGTVVRIETPCGAYRQLFDDHGVDRAAGARLAMTSGLPAEELVDRLGAKRSRDALLRFHERLDRELASITVYPDAEELFERLAGPKPWIVSNLAEPYCVPVLSLLGDRIAGASFSCRVGALKPDPEIYRHAMAGCGAPGRVLMVGDSRRCDLEGARACGIDSLLLTRGSEGKLSSLCELLPAITPHNKKPTR